MASMCGSGMVGFFEHTKLLLAPMAGVTDEAFRQICIEQGADLTYTEMVSAKGLSYANEKTRSLLNTAPNEEKVAVQIFGHEPSTMAQEASRIAEHLDGRLAYIDINMGCPAKKIIRKGDGCALMQQSRLAKTIIEEVGRAVDGAVTVKFRRGFSLGDDTAVPFAQMVEQAGAAALAVHGRYAEQLYRGMADWNVIARVKEAVSIPVIGNGDVRQGQDARIMRDQTACDAVMIGRGAEGNPWIFAAARAALQGMPAPEGPGIKERIAMARRHAELLSQREGKSIVRMRKHAMWYFSGLPGASAARRAINDCTTLEEFYRVFDGLAASAYKDDGTR